MKCFTCCHCKSDKPESDFYRDRSRPSGRKPRCKSCEKLYIDRKARSEYEKIYRANNPAQRKDIVRRSMRKHKDRIAAKRKEYLQTDGGREVYRRYTQKRYAQRKAAFVENVNPKDVYKDQGGVCYICEICFSFDDMELDHVVPLAAGGKHERSNTKMACAPCNRGKGARPLWEVRHQMV